MHLLYLCSTYLSTRTRDILSSLLHHRCWTDQRLCLVWATTYLNNSLIIHQQYLTHSRNHLLHPNPQYQQLLPSSSTQPGTTLSSRISTSSPSETRLYKHRSSLEVVNSGNVLVTPPFSPFHSSLPSLHNHKSNNQTESKAQELCAITSLPARYRDPDTGLAYRDARAYQEIQKLKRGEYKWSKLLGAYVGLGTYHAKGVPEKFRGALPTKAKEPNVEKTDATATV